ncbi:hypothetical protein [Actinomadura madurae]|uniref:hypothetical protein n=1 Tax=Actinomadura madurae TaxID=1993 RepID=UPI0020D2568B|nr:hypothetical protein [Actinomadura madurae]MCQ0021203.1 hypothetical protein [Actinomadura madurae]
MCRWTGSRCSPERASWTCRPTPFRGSGTGWSLRRPHRRAPAGADTAHLWRYRVGWQQITVEPGAALRGTWIVAVPENGVDEEWIASAERSVRHAGAEVRRLTVTPQDDRERLAELLGEGGDGVLSFLPLTPGGHPEHPAVPAGLASTVALVQALTDAGARAPLWHVTRGAVGVAAGEAPADPAQGTVWGLGRVAAAETPELRGGLLDVTGDGGGEGAVALGALASVLGGGHGETELALRRAACSHDASCATARTRPPRATPGTASGTARS